jgi:ceramide glucosyltransferase
MPVVLPLLLAAVLAGSAVYCILTVLAVASWKRQKTPGLSGVEPVSVLKPLHGLDDGLEDNLRSFFTQQYPDFELLFAARDAADPALEVVRKLSAEYPGVPVRTFVTGEPPWPNAKAWSLSIMTREARNSLLVMSDSDIRTGPDLLRTVAAEFQDPRLGVSTCPYRAVPGRSFWSTLEAIGMNTEFWGGVFTARLVERGVRFAVGPTASARRAVIEAIGGWEYLSQFLAEDFVLGREAAAKGYGVALSRHVVEHRIGAQAWRANFAHRLRWNRSTRRSRPAGYVGQLFTNPLPIALLLCALLPAWWAWILLPTLALRAAAAFTVAWTALRDRLSLSLFFLVPVQDAASFVFWLAGFFGNTIVWRGRRYEILPDGRFRLKSREG